MNLDDLMAVWKSQDAAPLHDVNKTLLHLALRQDEAKLQKERRRERWIIYVFSAGLVAAMAVVPRHDDLFPPAIAGKSDDRLGFRHWDCRRGRRPARGGRDVCGPPGAGAARATLWRVASRSTQPAYRAARDRATIARETLVSVLLWGICPMAILLLGYRINDKSISDDGYMLVSLIFMCVVWSGGERRLGSPPPVQRDGVAAQAPAGGVAEGARCSVDSRLEMSAMSIRSDASLSYLARVSHASTIGP